jgi:hypothetical protein
VGQVVVVTIGDDIGQQFVQNQVELINVLDREGALLAEGLDPLRELGDIPGSFRRVKLCSRTMIFNPFRSGAAPAAAGWAWW